MSALRVASGCRGWSRIAAFNFRGTYAAEGLSGPFSETIDTKLGRSVTKIREGGFTSASGFDGTTAWSQDQSGASHPLDDAHARAMARTNAWLDRRGWCDSRDGTRYREVGMRRRVGETFDAVSATPRGGAPVTMWINRETHLLRLTEEQYNEYRTISSYKDWRTIADIAFPFERVDVDPEDGESTTFRSREATAVAAPPRSDFARPASPHDSSIRGGRDIVRVAYRDEAQKPIVNVEINGRGPFPFVVDTGGHFIVTTATARTLGLIGSGDVKSLGAGSDVRTAQFAAVRRLDVGGAIVTNLVGKIVRFGYRSLERGTRAPKAGWLGLEFFERFAATFDPTRHTITLARLDRPRPLGSGVRLPLTFDDDAPFVQCTIEHTTDVCMVDTGNQGPTIVEGHWIARHGLRNAFAGGIRFDDGVSARRADIRIGPIVARHVLLEAIPAAPYGSEAATAEAAVLSDGLLNRYVMTVDYQRRAVWLRPIAHSVDRPFNRTGLVVEKTSRDAFVVDEVIDDSPARSAGFRPGDRILSVDGRSAETMSARDFSDTNVGAIGSAHTYRVRSGAARAERSVTIHLRELLP